MSVLGVIVSMRTSGNKVTSQRSCATCRKVGSMFQKQLCGFRGILLRGKAKWCRTAIRLDINLCSGVEQ
jgi:hypothetical protein